MAMGIDQNLKSFTDSGDVSIWVKDSRMGRNTINKKDQNYKNILSSIYISDYNEIYSTRNVIFYMINDRIGLTHDTIDYTKAQKR